MRPIEILMNEHRLIESVLTALEAYVDRLGPSESPEGSDLGRFTLFIRAFADTCHHGKEEDILFKTMVEHGMPQESGPIAVMLHEHEEGRRLVRELAGFAARSVEPGWSETDRQSIRIAAHSFAELLRQHIQKEDGILYPIASARLDAPTMADIARRFELFETEKTGPGEHEKLHALAEELIARYGAPGGTDPGSHRCH